MDMPSCTLVRQGDIFFARIDSLKVEGMGSDPNQAFAALQAELGRLKAAHDASGGGPLRLEGIAPATPPGALMLGGTVLRAMTATLTVLFVLGMAASIGAFALYKSVSALNPIATFKLGLDRAVAHADGLTPEGSSRLQQDLRTLVGKAAPLAAELRPLVGAITPSCPQPPPLKTPSVVRP